ncbi:MAG: hypothetical protein Q8P59_09110 [Dehalococcoidia bacterium]|nr:hypothetical protein [Dehalococcoidia bacterium]
MLGGPYTDVQQARVVLMDNRIWLEAHIEEVLGKYRGRVIAVHGKQVVASASSAMAPGETQVREVRAAIKDRYPEEETLVIMMPVSGIAEIYYPT